jgi:catechol 2,3-dioxygenase-like lactoylglutathione lyase family enzyme
MEAIAKLTADGKIFHPSRAALSLKNAIGSASRPRCDDHRDVTEAGGMDPDRERSRENRLSSNSIPNESGVTMGHLHLNVRDVEANKKFFALLGGTPLEIDGTQAMKFPGALIFLTPGAPRAPGTRRTEVFCGCPADGIEASMVNHAGFNVRDYDEFFAKFQAAGYHMEDFHGAKGRTFLFSPDGLMLEVAQSRSVTAAAGELHLHIFVSDVPPKDRDHQVVPFEMYLWYARTFGATLMKGGPGSGLGADLPGVRLRISQTRLSIEPTKGHVLDHIGFEVRNLEAFCKQLEANGVKLDKPYSTSRHHGFASAEFTDPWGMSVELTGGLVDFELTLEAPERGQCTRGRRCDKMRHREPENRL